MNQPSQYLRCGLEALAWAFLTLCIAIVVLAGAVGYVSSPKSVAALEPLPVLRWDDIQPYSRTR